MNKNLILFTGPPCSGKSTFIEGFLQKMDSEGIKAAAVNDINYFDDWRRDPKNRDYWFEVGETFSLKEEAYPLVSVFSAEKIGLQVQSFFEQGNEVVLAEAARGAFGMDNYFGGLLVPIVRILGESCQIGNYEIVTNNLEELLRRAERRYEEDSRLPPPEVVLKYFKDGGLIISSREELEASVFKDRLFINERIVNGAGREGVREVVNEIYPKILEAIDHRRSKEQEAAHKKQECL